MFLITETKQFNFKKANNNNNNGKTTFTLNKGVIFI